MRRFLFIAAIGFCNTVFADEQSGRVGNVNIVGADRIMQAFLGLLAVVAVMFFIAWIFKRMNLGSMSSRGPIKLIDQIGIGSKERIVLVQVGEEQVLLGVCPGSIEALHALDKPVRIDTAKRETNSFLDIFKKISKGENK